ncbi:MAG: SIMPL domain-containing protein [Candidatus Nanopelagicaceae bacterium]|nr:SIMPL domain-containing protein [Candidatus Nanopelagicaceae bacterium]
MKKLNLKRIAVITMAAAIVGGVLLAPASSAATPNRYLSISADGTVKVTPDAVRINATVTSVAGTSKEALAATATSAAAVRTAFLANGIAARDIATQSVTIYPEYKYTQDGGSVLIGYRASQNFIVVVRKASTAGIIVDAIVTAGGDSLQLNGVTPFVLDSSKATASARTAAVKNAKAKAASYASLLGVKLGKVNHLIENSSPSPYPPIMSVSKDSAGSTEIDLGLQDVTVSISVQWALK